MGWFPVCTTVKKRCLNEEYFMCTHKDFISVVHQNRERERDSVKEGRQLAEKTRSLFNTSKYKWEYKKRSRKCKQNLLTFISN